MLIHALPSVTKKPSPLLLKVLPRVTKSPPYVTKSHACLPVTLSFITINLSTCLLVNLSTYSLTLSPSYPVIPLSPVTHRTCSSVTLSFITINLSTCLLVNLSTYPLTLSSSYPVIPLSPVTPRTCSSVTLSFLPPRVFPLSSRQPVNLPCYPVFLIPCHTLIPCYS